MSYEQSNRYYYNFYYPQQPYQYQYSSDSYYTNGAYQPYASTVVYNYQQYVPTPSYSEHHNQLNEQPNKEKKLAVYVSKSKALNNPNSLFKPIDEKIKPILKKYRPVYSPENIKQYVNMADYEKDYEKDKVLQSTIVSSIETNNNYNSKIEKEIHNSLRPIDLDRGDTLPQELLEMNINGIWINKSESDNWTPGKVPLTQYKLQIDLNPRIIKLKYPACIERIENRTIKFLKPTPPSPHGDIVITQLPDYQPPEAPPIIVRQEVAEPCEPKPKIVRERPPVPDEILPTKNITIPGKILDPPPRRVIIEKLVKEPDYIPDVIVERWLPYEEQKRRVIFNDAKPLKPIEIEKNIEYIWETPCVEKRVEFNNLGVETVDPNDYQKKYNGSLVNSSSQLPEFALQVPVPAGVDMTKNGGHTLVGDVNALRKIDLEREGLTRYKSYIASSRS